MACPPGNIQIRRDTLANWNIINPVLAPGELAFAYPTTSAPEGILKIGSQAGETWSQAQQIFPSSGGTGNGPSGPTGPTGPQGWTGPQGPTGPEYTPTNFRAV